MILFFSSILISRSILISILQDVLYFCCMTSSYIFIFLKNSSQKWGREWYNCMSVSTFIFHVFCDGSCLICWYTLLASSLPPSSSLRASRPLFSFRRIEMSEYWRGWSSISSRISLVINLYFKTPRNIAKQTDRSVAAAT